MAKKPSDHFQHLKFIVSKFTKQHLQVNVSPDIFDSLSRYVSSIKKSDSKIINEATLIIKGIKVAKRNHNQSFIAFVEKEKKIY